MKCAGEHVVKVELPETAVKAAIVVMRLWSKECMSKGKDEDACDIMTLICEAKYALENAEDDE